MRILIVYSKEGNMGRLADALQKGAESKGHQVTVKMADQNADMVTAHMFDMVLVGSPVLGIFGGKVASDIKPFVSSMKRLEGKDVITFTRRKLIGTDKAMRKLMEIMESQGSVVKDFRNFTSVEEAREFARNL